MIRLLALLAFLPSPALAGDALAEVMAGMDRDILAGRIVGRELAGKLAALAPGDRLVAVAYARRTGLLTGPTLPLEVLLAPAAKEEAP